MRIKFERYTKQLSFEWPGFSEKLNEKIRKIGDEEFDAAQKRCLNRVYDLALREIGEEKLKRIVDILNEEEE